jgi:hypothetical protein
VNIPINHIKGALSGAIIGETLAQEPRDYFKSDFSQISPYLTIALTGINTIINHCDLDQKSWLIHLLDTYPDYLKYKNNLNLSQTAIALIPLLLYYQENACQLEQKLTQALQLWLKPELNPNLLKLWCLIISQICQNKLGINPDNDHLFQDLINQKNLDNFPELKLIEQCLTSKLTLTQVSIYLPEQLNSDSLAIYQALYCFYGLPDDFYLCSQRATKINQQPILTSCLTGFMLGLANGYYGIPWDYRHHLESTQFYPEIAQGSTNLVKIWQGEYLSNDMNNLNPH